jgi:IstB-like ATP binding protein
VGGEGRAQGGILPHHFPQPGLHIIFLSQTGAELLFQVFSQRYKRGSTIVTSNLPFDEWTSVFGAERLTGALLDRLTHHVHVREINDTLAFGFTTRGR